MLDRHEVEAALAEGRLELEVRGRWHVLRRHDEFTSLSPAGAWTIHCRYGDTNIGHLIVSSQLEERWLRRLRFADSPRQPLKPVRVRSANRKRRSAAGARRPRRAVLQPPMPKPAVGAS